MTKVMTIFKEPRIGYSTKNITLTSSYNDWYVTYETRRSDVLDPVTFWCFVARAVVNRRIRPLAKSPHYSDQAGANSHSL